MTVDFSRDDLFEQLAEAGYDPPKRTIFPWEGVTLYLSEDAVRQTMQAVRCNLGETFFLGSASDKGPFAVVAELVV